MTELKIAIVAGEHSGDILGADLMSALCDLAAEKSFSISFKGVAGPKMQALGAESMFDMDELSVMGLFEILKRLPRLLKKRKQLAADLIEWQPDVLIGIDAPEFNLGLELMLKERGITTVHYVSPSVWAWRQSRIKTIKKACDLVLALLPFEQAFYQQHDMPCEFVGHTMADQIPLEDQQNTIRERLQLPLNQTILGVLPGSRGSEIKFLLRPFLITARQLTMQIPNLLIMIPAVNDYRAKAIQSVIDEAFSDLNIKLSIGNARDVMGASNAVLLASGTATLETMLMKTPMVAGYQVGWLSYQVFSRMIKTPYFTLPNLLANKELVPELIQHEMTVENMVEALLPMLTKPQNELKQQFFDIHQNIQRNASLRAANAIWPLIKRAKAI
ncbi:lipid-A-disaccharide synthase [Psychrosphaera sp. B3R10]|uniref:lipid-A-disaccharide synthase n=1 Tax=unclassified Psychrosphaera TaxID=2641570 RepID=UPI001C08884D|nr:MULTISPECIES: lipid-A-disaccharide synthase [unclassified Psychrosphaera]MBU2883900.1 lipid-A-disaccharide synthase [Psychrosphaera sp. I2R16]MBU2988763.1 lipid-A-disaccharide synthase [Psychrosphaera sp. B3R10]MDO6718549.1 lipid-A-disaccharide synthase [Psychrosphaera sp. 1_MG-2023]